MNGTESERPRWRDDPLSVFLLLAALLLGGMYLLERAQTARLDEAAANAHALSETAWRPPDCTLHAAGQAGDTLVLDCRAATTTLESIAEAVAGAPAHDFESVIVVRESDRMRCPPAPDEWPAACQPAE